MNLAFLSLQFCRYPLERCFEMAAHYGYQGVELWGARPHAYPGDMDAAAVRQINQLKKKYGVEVPMYTPELLAYPYNLVSPNERERDETVAYLKEAVRVCAAMECPGMLLTAGHPGYGRSADEVWRDLIFGLREVAGTAKTAGIQLCMESLGPDTSPVISRSDDLLRLIQDVDMPCFGAMLDMAIPPLVGEPFSEYFEKLRGHTKYVHLCGCDGVYETHLQPTDGTIPFEDFFAILDRCGYAGWCSVEVLEPYYRDPELYLAQSRRFLRQVLGE